MSLWQAYARRMRSGTFGERACAICARACEQIYVYYVPVLMLLFVYIRTYMFAFYEILCARVAESASDRTHADARGVCMRL